MLDPLVGRCSAALPHFSAASTSVHYTVRFPVLRSLVAAGGSVYVR